MVVDGGVRLENGEEAGAIIQCLPKRKGGGGGGGDRHLRRALKSATSTAASAGAGIRLGAGLTCDSHKTGIRRRTLPGNRRGKRRSRLAPFFPDVEDRVIPFMKEFVFPLVNDNKNVLVVAHSGVLRTIIRYIKASDETEIVKLEIENAMPYILYGHVRED